MAADICNQLEKLVPPAFVTVAVDLVSSKDILLVRKKILRRSNYERNVEHMQFEIDFLNGYILRKGQQLRLEKALLLTNQVLKLGQRWKGNDFLRHLKKFLAAFTKKKSEVVLRPPSRQWASWILYLMLRETALLAKLKLECEKSTQYWLGLIATAHHWGDSLVITAILSRIWNLSSNIVQEMIQQTYTLYAELYRLLKPTKSSAWPNEEWKIPEDLYVWLKDTMKLSFEIARLNVSLSYFNRNASAPSASGVISSVISKSYRSKQKIGKSKSKECEQEVGQEGFPYEMAVEEQLSVMLTDDSDTLNIEGDGTDAWLNEKDDTNDGVPLKIEEQDEEEDLGILVAEDGSNSELQKRKKKKRGRKNKKRKTEFL